MRELLQHFSAREVDSVLALCTTDVVWYPAVSAVVEGKPYQGHEGLRTYFADLDDVWEEFTVEPEEVRDLGDSVLVLSQARLKGRGGAAFEQSLDLLYRLRGGKVRWGRSYLDRGDALEDAGVSVKEGTAK